jgi:ribosome-associated protein
VLDLRDITSFADHFVLCSGANTRQVQAIADEIQAVLKKQGEYPNSVEGYENAEWVLVDYGDYLIHIFSEKARTYYDLERLWRDAKREPLPTPQHG